MMYPSLDFADMKLGEVDSIVETMNLTTVSLHLTPQVTDFSKLVGFHLYVLDLSSHLT